MPAQALPRGTARFGTARLIVPAWVCSTCQAASGPKVGQLAAKQERMHVVAAELS